MLTQVFGVRGSFGDLLLAPKFTAHEFDKNSEVSIQTRFAGKTLYVTYKNPKKISYEFYCVKKVSVDGKELKNLDTNKQEALIPREVFLKSSKSVHPIVVTLE